MFDTHQKALEINLAPDNYGVFAEIGAGQEVARWLFRVGGASGSVAKTISAYDMTFSDAIYGPAERYVSQGRLQQMLAHEFNLLRERLSASRGEGTRFFAFADTVAARSFSRIDDTHGWMGVRFQHKPLAEPSEIIVHVRMLDADSVAQHEAIGVLGVNLIHAALNRGTPKTVMDALLDNLSTERVEVDMVRFTGPAFPDVDNRLMSLELVRKGLSPAAMIAANGQVVQPAGVLYKRPILVVRGSFRPPTKTMMDLRDGAMAQFVQAPQVGGEEVVVLTEMTLSNLLRDGEISPEDFLARADMLNAMGHTVLISNFDLHFKLAEYLFGFTKKMIGLTMGVPMLREVFDEKYYEGLSGGILEAFGRLFEQELRLYVYPQRDPKSRVIIRADNLVVTPNLRHLLAHLLENRHIEPIRGYNEDYLGIFRADVLDAIKEGGEAWAEMVPEVCVEIIRERNLWGYGG